MEKILDIISVKMQQAFQDAGYDAAFGRVTVSNRPDLCQFQCNGALTGAKLVQGCAARTPTGKGRGTAQGGGYTLCLSKRQGGSLRHRL